MSDDEGLMSAGRRAGPGSRSEGRSGPASRSEGRSGAPSRSEGRSGPGSDDLARALGALLGLPPAVPATAPPPVTAAPAAVALRAVPPPAVPPVLPVPPVRAATSDDSFWGPSPVDLHPSADPGATALAESGFGGPLHQALGELRRLSAGGPVTPVPAVSPEPERPAERGPEPQRPAARDAEPEREAAPVAPDTAATGGVAEKVAAAAFADGPSATPDPYTGPDPRSGGPDWARRGRRQELAAWWAFRRRELIPGMVVAGLVMVAFVVVLLSGGKSADTTRVGSDRRVPIDPSTTIPGLFATAGTPDDLGEPPGPGDSPDNDRSPSAAAVGAVTTTTKTSAATGSSPTAGPSPPSPPGPTSPPPTSPPPTTTPPDTTPDTTTPPDTTPDTTVPDTTPDTVPDICEIRPERC